MLYGYGRGCQHAGSSAQLCLQAGEKRAAALIQVQEMCIRDRDYPLEEVIFQTPIENLYVMPAGPTPFDPSGALNSRKFNELLPEVKQRCLLYTSRCV